MRYLIYATNGDWFENISKLSLSENSKVAFWRTSDTKNFSKNIKRGDAFLFLVDMGDRKEVVGIGTFEYFCSTITVGDLWNKYGKNTGANSLNDLLAQLNVSGNRTPYSVSTLISFIELSNVQSDLRLGNSPWKLL